MTEQAGSSGQNWKDPPDTAASFPQEIAALEEARRDIGTILGVLHAAKLPLTVLEVHLVDVPVADLTGADKARDSDEQEEVRLAVYLYSIALACRDIVENRRFNTFLRSIRYTKDNTEVLLASFNKLADAWSAYQPLIELLDVAGWHGEPTRDQLWTALKRPRRDYIDALGAYYIQLLSVHSKLEAAGGGQVLP